MSEQQQQQQKEPYFHLAPETLQYPSLVQLWAFGLRSPFPQKDASTLVGGARGFDYEQ